MNTMRHGSQIIRSFATANYVKGSQRMLCKVPKRVFQTQTVSDSSSASTEIYQKSATNYNKTCYSTRSHTCGELSTKHVGMTVCLKGWIQFNRKKFLVLRDAYGITQILLSDLDESMQKVVNSLTLESVVEVEGQVVMRPEDQINLKLVTGRIEVKAHAIHVLAAAPSQLPLYIRDKKLPTDFNRLKYRYLYLRYPHMQKNLRIRSAVIHAMRQFLIQKDFVDVETPTLFRKTPGGSQEFIVPTQTSGLFYSLVQSPQQLKQLLMVGGLDRYFQIARCYRDETVRFDRQPEFTQLDIELSFTDRDGITTLIEELLRSCWPGDVPVPKIPFLQMTYAEAMSNYGSDKPDLRFDSKIQDITHLVQSRVFSPLARLSKIEDFTAKLIVFPGAAGICQTNQLTDVKKRAQQNILNCLVNFVQLKSVDDFKISLSNIFSVEELDKIAHEIKPEVGSLIILALGADSDVLKVLGLLRELTANTLEENGFAIRDKQHHFLWVVDFPLFELDSEGCLQSAHHPFTQPHPDDMHLLNTHPLKVRGLHYDLVLDGAEIGGGSIRISDAQLQKHILHDLLRLDTSSFQHLLDALSFGCPPHGGIALGLDRLISFICQEKSIKEVIAFPKALEGKDPMAGAPAPLTAEDANIYHLPFTFPKGQ